MDNRSFDSGIRRIEPRDPKGLKRVVWRKNSRRKHSGRKYVSVGALLSGGRGILKVVTETCSPVFITGYVLIAVMATVIVLRDGVKQRIICSDQVTTAAALDLSVAGVQESDRTDKKSDSCGSNNSSTSR